VQLASPRFSAPIADSDADKSLVLKGAPMQPSQGVPTTARLERMEVTIGL